MSLAMTIYTRYRQIKTTVVITARFRIRCTLQNFHIASASITN